MVISRPPGQTESQLGNKCPALEMATQNVLGTAGFDLGAPAPWLPVVSLPFIKSKDNTDLNNLLRGLARVHVYNYKMVKNAGVYSFFGNPGNIMLGIGSAHQALALIVPEIRGPLVETITKGFAGTYGDDFLPITSRAFAEFFVLSGNLMLIMGHLMKRYIQDTKKPLPSQIGWALLAITLPGVYFNPISGESIVYSRI